MDERPFNIYTESCLSFIHKEYGSLSAICDCFSRLNGQVFTIHLLCGEIEHGGLQR